MVTLDGLSKRGTAHSLLSTQFVFSSQLTVQLYDLMTVHSTSLLTYQALNPNKHLLSVHRKERF